MLLASLSELVYKANRGSERPARPLFFKRIKKERKQGFRIGDDDTPPLQRDPSNRFKGTPYSVPIKLDSNQGGHQLSIDTIPRIRITLEVEKENFNKTRN